MTNEELIQAYRNGDISARDKLAEQNKGLVCKAAINYTFHGRFELDDLIQEGYLGLLHAIEKYNPDLEHAAAFSTYSSYWINCYLHLYIKRNSHKNVSLDAPIGGENEDLTLLDTLADQNAGPEEMGTENEFNRELRGRVSGAINAYLPLREQEVIKMRYGFYGKCVSLEKIGEMFNCTKESVRQQENRALRKLRGCSSILILKRELSIEGYISNLSRLEFNTEHAAIKRLYRHEKLNRNTSCRCSGNENFFIWYSGLFKNRAVLSRELDRASNSNCLFPEIKNLANKSHYNETIKRQVEIQEKLNEIDKTIEAVNHFTGELIHINGDMWSIMRSRFTGDVNRDLYYRNALGAERYMECIDRAIEYIRKSLEVNSIQYRF